MKILTIRFLICLLITACLPKDNQPYFSTNFELIKLTGGVFACIHKIGGKAICNAGIIDNGEETIIFDTFLSPVTAEEIPDIIAHHGLSPIKYVVNSHFHNDHIRGNQVFEPGVTIISTKRTMELIKENEPDQIKFEAEFAEERFRYYDSLRHAFEGDTTSRAYKQIMMWVPYYEILTKSSEEVQTRLPTLTFNDSMNLNGSKRKVQLISNGKGHTENDLILYLPDDRILYTGDLVFNNCHPYLGHGYSEEWKDWLDEMLTMDIEVLVPGHGELGDLNTAEQMIRYIEDLEILANSMIRDSLTVEQINEVEIPESYRTWWFERFFAYNLSFMYTAITDSNQE